MSLEETITSIDRAISDTYVDIKKSEKSIALKADRVDQYENMSIDMSLRIRKNRTTILAYLTNIYSESTIIFDEKNNLDIIQSLILSGDSVDSISTDIMYKSLVSILGQKFIDEYRSLLRDYYKIAMKIKEEVALLEVDKSLLERQKSTLAAQRNQREALLSATQ